MNISSTRNHMTLVFACRPGFSPGRARLLLATSGWEKTSCFMQLQVKMSIDLSSSDEKESLQAINARSSCIKRRRRSKRKRRKPRKEGDSLDEEQLAEMLGEEEEAGEEEDDDSDGSYMGEDEEAAGGTRRRKAASCASCGDLWRSGEGGGMVICQGCLKCFHCGCADGFDANSGEEEEWRCLACAGVEEEEEEEEEEAQKKKKRTTPPSRPGRTSSSSSSASR